MGLGSDMVAKLHAPLAAAAAVVTAAAASSAEFSDNLHYKAATPLLLYAARSSAFSGNSVSEMQVKAVANSGSILPESSLFSSSFCAPAICLYGGANVSVPASFFCLHRVSPSPSPAAPPPPALRFQDWNLRQKSNFLPPSMCQMHGRFSQSSLDFFAASLLSPVSLYATALLRAQQAEMPSSLARLPASVHLVRLLSILRLHGYGSSSAISKASFHMWHKTFVDSLEVAQGGDAGAAGAKRKPELTVVLLGWLGSHQKHLKKYADWYTSRGIPAVTFVIPIKDIVLLRSGGKAEEHVDKLAQHLVGWLNDRADGEDGEDGDRQLLFHTFSNTGWLTYGVLLEKLLKLDEKLLNRIKGCVVDSAPAAKPDPQIWANGFSAALLAKRSVAVKKAELKQDGSSATDSSIVFPEPNVAEAAFLALLRKFFTYFLMIPSINGRLYEVISILSKRQPSCPQLYMYSTADRVIPHTLVEAFIQQQRQDGRVVRACNLQLSPHVDHFRTFPDIYGKQLQSFLHDCIFKGSSR